MVRRGDLHWANPPKIGKHRFLIVQDDSFNRKFDEVLAVPIVSEKKEETNSWEVEVPEETFPEPSIVNCSAIVLIEKSDLGDFITSLGEKTMQGVDYALSITLGLQDW
ncbi:type II toxin-antitoxin system PemK/MazF family toxin [Candidatus Bipolaricaulota bacterium]|nr:type II toxin-antitoxin system PemK/MazF family toxin [Candidatus Bipolaricaulota bacterium]